MYQTYSHTGLKRLGACLIDAEKPVNSKAATALLKERLGAYVANTKLISDLVRQRYEDASSS